MMIDCREAVARMWAYLSRDLEQQRTDELDEHLGVCMRCCGELEFNRELRARVAEAGTEQVPAPVRSRIDALLGGDEAPSRGAG